VDLRDLTRALGGGVASRAGSRGSAWRGRVFLVIDADRWAAPGLTLVGSAWSGACDGDRAWRTVLERAGAEGA
jgi:hypothetical protein